VSESAREICLLLRALGRLGLTCVSRQLGNRQTCCALILCDLPLGRDADAGRRATSYLARFGIEWHELLRGSKNGGTWT